MSDDRWPGEDDWGSQPPPPLAAPAIKDDQYQIPKELLASCREDESAFSDLLADDGRQNINDDVEAILSSPGVQFALTEKHLQRLAMHPYANVSSISNLINSGCPLTTEAIKTMMDMKPVFLLPLLESCPDDVAQELRASHPHLMIEAIKRNFCELAECVQVMIDKLKFDVNFVSKDANYKHTALQAAIDQCNDDVMNELLRWPQIDLNLTTALTPHTPLQLAVVEGHYSMAAALITDHFADWRQLEDQFLSKNLSSNGFSQLFAVLWTFGCKMDIEGIKKRMMRASGQEEEDEFDWIDTDMPPFSRDISDELRIFFDWTEGRDRKLHDLKVLAAAAVRVQLDKKEFNEVLDLCQWPGDVVDAFYLRHVHVDVPEEGRFKENKWWRGNRMGYMGFDDLDDAEDLDDEWLDGDDIYSDFDHDDDDYDDYDGDFGF